MALDVETARLTPSMRVLEKIGFRRDHSVTNERGEIIYVVRDL